MLCSLSTSCGLLDSNSAIEYQPAQTSVGPLAISTWLPAGLDQFRFEAEDQELLRQLGVNQIEWLQRATRDSLTAEQLAMEFCNDNDLQMPVFYEPLGFSPYDKLHNWARRTDIDSAFVPALEKRIAALHRQWDGAPGFLGYLVGHEDYRQSYYPALRLTIENLRRQDPQRPAVTVGFIDSYPAVEQFLDAFFQPGGPANIFQHEHYVFRADVPSQGPVLQRRLDHLVEGYSQVARRLQNRHGRWHAIVQVQSEERHGNGFDGFYYRKPTGAEIRLQAGLALTRGASGIVYFLYSSGLEEARNSDGEIFQRRLYEGLVDREGIPTPAYTAAQRLNAQLDSLSAYLAPLHFHGGYTARRAPANALARSGDADVELGFFGDGEQPTHVLVLNRRPQEERSVHLQIARGPVEDLLSGQTLPPAGDTLTLMLPAAGMRLLRFPLP
ncbi:MAG: hypothetical protein GKR89_25200 [Candidatus Latescibacteria bacterium]|nr:hypothetical protein [Candidatus Latescibacterota bacterium]